MKAQEEHQALKKKENEKAAQRRKADAAVESRRLAEELAARDKEQKLAEMQERKIKLRQDKLLQKKKKEGEYSISNEFSEFAWMKEATM